MNEEEDRRVFDLAGRLPDIQVKGIFAHRLQEIVIQGDAELVIDRDIGEGGKNSVCPLLHGHGRKGVAGPDSFPAVRFLRFLPAKFPYRRFRVRDTGVDFHRAVFIEYTGEVALLYRDNFRLLGILYGNGRDHPDRRLRYPDNNCQNGEKAEPAENLEPPALSGEYFIVHIKKHNKGGSGSDPPGNHVFPKLQDRGVDERHQKE